MSERCPNCTGEQRERCEQIVQTFVGDLSVNTIPLILGLEVENEAAKVLGPADTTELAMQDFEIEMMCNNCTLDSYGYTQLLTEISDQSLINTGLLTDEMLRELKEFRDRNQP